jgi:hypothetical protein
MPSKGFIDGYYRKRNTTADWAQFSEVFGMPIREYIYETDDDEARHRAAEDAQTAGGAAMLCFRPSKYTAHKTIWRRNCSTKTAIYGHLNSG